MNRTLRAILAELRTGLEALYGQRLAQLFLYGSQTRGDAEPGSDIDILVVLRGPVSPGEEIARTGPFLAALCLRHNQLVCCVFISEERLLAERSPLLLNVRKEGVPV